MEELALPTLAAAHVFAERSQQFLLSIPVDEHILVGPRIPVRHGFAPRCCGDQFDHVRRVPRFVLHRSSSSRGGDDRSGFSVGCADHPV